MNTLLISASKIDKIQQCPELFRYLYVKELSGFTKPLPLEQGDLFHKLLELYYTAKKNSLDYNIENIVELARNHATSLSLESSVVEANIALFKEYVLYYSNETWVPEEVEVPFAVTLLEDKTAELRIVLEGKIDLLAKEGKTGTELVVDHKRVSRNYTPYDRDNQKLAYCFVSGRRDFIINQVGDQKSYSVDKRLQRYYFNYSEHMIDEFVENTIEWAFEMLRVIKANDEGSFVKRNYGSCYHFNMKCMFYDVCNTTPDNKEYKLSEAFKPKTDHDIFE